jgi:hypothetical protein
VELAPLGATQGLDACWQICPTAVFPLAIPFTLQVTDVSEVLITVGISVTRWLVSMDALVGEMLTATVLTIVIVAETVAPPATAWIVTGFVAGRLAGAAYEAVVAPVATMVPTAALPPGIPFTSQAIAAAPIPQKVVVKVCACPSAT